MQDGISAKIDGVKIELSRRKAEGIPDRAFRFLRGVGLFPEIMERLSEAGYAPDIHKQGWDLLHLSSGYAPDSPARVSESHRDAVMALDAWDEPNFRRTKGALQHRFPSQHAYIFEDLSAQQGFAALYGVQTYLRRVEALRDGTDPARAGSRDQDKAAFALLEQRKILSPETLQQLHGWIKTAQEAPDLPQASEEQKKHKEEANRALVQLAVWYDEWSEVAHAQISKRNYLISLGLAKRRTTKDEEEEDTPTTSNPASSPSTGENA